MEGRVVVVGGSLGGQAALRTLLAGLPEGFPSPVVVVLHRGKSPDDALAPFLQQGSALKVAEAEDKEPLEPGRVYVAPADYHLLVDRDGLALSTEARVANARPSIDVLFESAALTCGDRAVGVVLTGASADGAAGARRIKERGGTVLVQDPGTAEAPAMPEAAIAATTPDRIAKLAEIPVLLMEFARKREWVEGLLPAKPGEVCARRERPRS